MRLLRTGLLIGLIIFAPLSGCFGVDDAREEEAKLTVFDGENLLEANNHLEIIKEDIRNLDNQHFKDGYGVIDL